MSKIVDCVVVCVNFSDVLAHTLPLNKSAFNRMVVVTDMKDKATQTLCDYHSVECVRTDDFYRSDHAFNKGLGINAGLAHLSPVDWVLQMDADIALPSRFRCLVETVVELDASCIYGIDRLMCPSFDDWIEHMAHPTRQHVDDIFVIPDAFPLGTRVAGLGAGHEGYCPLGFFQLWNPAASAIDRYPEETGSAGKSDMDHSFRWPRIKRVLIPEIFAIHLGSDLPVDSNNYRGRVSSPFGPTSVIAGAGGGFSQTRR